MFRPFADWLAATPLSQLFQNQMWIVPTSQSIHIVCVCLVFTSALMINLRLLGVGASGRSISQLTHALLPWMWGGLAVLLLTGTVQAIAEPVRQFVTPAFWAKMIMVIIVTAMTAAFARKVRANAARWDTGGHAPGERPGVCDRLVDPVDRNHRVRPLHRLHLGVLHLTDLRIMNLHAILTSLQELPLSAAVRGEIPGTEWLFPIIETCTCSP